MTEEREEFAIGDRVWNTQTGQTGTVLALSPSGGLALSRRTQTFGVVRAKREVPDYRPRWMFTKDPEKARRHFRARMQTAAGEAKRWETILASVVS